MAKAAAGKQMTKSEIAASLADSVSKELGEGKEVSKKAITTVLAHLATLACKQAKNGFPVPGLGKLVLSKSAPREMVMQFGPKKGQTVKVPAKTRVKFRIAKAAKDSILGVKK